MALVNNKFLKTTVAAIALQVCCENALAANIETNMARMQAMDKITGRVSEIDVPVNGEAKFGTFSVVVRRCVTRSPEETPENTAFVDVVDNYNTDDPVNIFKGWMFSSTPALNAVEHPIYDVWLIKCYNADLNGKKLLSQDELLSRDEIPMQVSEKDAEPVAISVGSNEDENKEIVEQTSALVSETAENQENIKSAEENKISQPAEVVSIVVNEDNTSSDDGTPKALLQVQTQPQPQTDTVAETPGPMMDAAPLQDEASANVVLPEVVDAGVEDENAYISIEDEENGFISEDEDSVGISEDTGSFQ